MPQITVPLGLPDSLATNKVEWKSQQVELQPIPGPAAAHRSLADAEPPGSAADHAAGRLVTTRPLTVWSRACPRRRRVG